jgi:hypothetical protein
MRLALLPLAWLLALPGSLHTRAAEPVRLKEGGYRFRGELYEATVDGHGRLASLQDDFAAFWQATMADMRARPLDLKVTPAPEPSNAHKMVSLVSFTGLGGRRIEGWLEEPADGGKYAASFGSRVQNYQWPKPGRDDNFCTIANARTAAK